jgi:hypothetical protein
MFHVGASKLVKVPTFDQRDLLLGAWFWTAEGQEDTTIELKDAGLCSIRKDTTMEHHAGEYCYWDVKD